MSEIKIKPDEVLEPEDVLRLLRCEIERAGGQQPWAKSMGVDRANLNRVLKGLRPICMSIIKALKLRVVFVPESSKVGPLPSKFRGIAGYQPKPKTRR
jgi:hypothetical protein